MDSVTHRLLQDLNLPLGGGLRRTLLPMDGTIVRFRIPQAVAEKIGKALARLLIGNTKVPLAVVELLDTRIGDKVKIG